MKIIKLSTLEQAQALVLAVYETFGLTHPRPWMNDPARILELNKRGDVVSFIAMEEHRVLGHLAAIRPHFELSVDGSPVCDPSTMEVGLSVIHEDGEDGPVQQELAAAVFSWAHRTGCSGLVLKCSTEHTGTQRMAEVMGGVPTALWLGAIPRGAESGGQASLTPVSTLAHYVRIHGDGARPLQLVPQNRGEADEDGPTELLVDFCTQRLRAHVIVHKPGADLLERLAETTVWLMGGHMEHISFAMPADSPRVAEVLPQLSEFGLFPAGMLPCWLNGRRDALLMQAVRSPVIDASAIRIRSHMAVDVREAVWTGFMQTRGSTTEILGMAGVPSRLRTEQRYAS
jgi:hypothetical protein